MDSVVFNLAVGRVLKENGQMEYGKGLARGMELTEANTTEHSARVHSTVLDSCVTTQGTYFMEFSTGVLGLAQASCSGKMAVYM
jgi:hypothetical protein